MQALRQRGEILPGSYTREDRWGEAAKLHAPAAPADPAAPL